MTINVTTLPNDILFIITTHLSTKEKCLIRESCTEFNNILRVIDIKTELMDIKYDKLINGRNYILGRLRLAALCGLNNYKVAEIWSWVSLVYEEKPDALSILRQLGQAII